jgi:hypothetical protein
MRRLGSLHGGSLVLKDRTKYSQIQLKVLRLTRKESSRDLNTQKGGIKCREEDINAQTQSLCRRYRAK